MKIYLASASPRRRELLEQIGLEFDVKVSDVCERVTATKPEKAVEELSEQKAVAVLEVLERERAAGAASDDPGQEQRPGVMPDAQEQRAVQEPLLVIGADTVVAAGGRILGKPSDPEEAAEMLALLAGGTHQVYTGVTLLYRTGEGKLLRRIFHEVTKVSFYPMSERDISRYLSTGDCMDKAGAYGIQGFCARYIRGIEGDYNNVVGLPVGRLYQEAKEWLEE